MKTFAMDTCSPKKIWRSNHVWNLIHHVACVHLGFWDRFNGYMSSSTSYYRRIYFMKTHDDNKISWIFIQKMEINGMLWDVSDKILQTRWYKVMKSNNANDYTSWFTTGRKATGEGGPSIFSMASTAMAFGPMDLGDLPLIKERTYYISS